MRLRSLLLMVLLAVLTLAVLPGSAQAQTGTTVDPRCLEPGYEDTRTVTVNDPVVDPGQTVTISGSGFLPGETVRVLVNGAQVGTALVDEQGNFTFQYTIPAGTAPGTVLNVSAVGVCGTGTLTITVTPTTSTSTGGGGGGGGAGSTTGGNLPRTGNDDTVWLLRGGALLVMVGGMLVLAARKRNRHGHAPGVA
ncbi:MAG: LPXTG cell wall anchor domain-containing protein [Acidimicrobiales bacterium]|nr:LPXTG cell wall anchor domain-containing protein [Acidimicrobiales bacterium]